MPDKPDLNELASRVSDGERIDWEQFEQGSFSDEERRVFLNLRLLDDVAQFHSREKSKELSGPGRRGEGSGQTPASREPRPAGEPSDDTELRSWGKLEIREKVGEGAFGEVYRAWDPKLDREVALKLLKKDASARESLAALVIREGRLLARINHPNVVTVHGSETHDGRVGLWMEFVRGRSLQGLLLEHGEYGAREAALIGLDLCRALAAVHQAGLIHGDVKARNVMRQEGGRILLMDFGAGRDLRDVEAMADQTVSGTPLYLAPEIYLGQTPTARSDIYGLGVLLFHLVSGDYPVQARSWRELGEKHRRREARLLRDVRSDLPEGFVKVVERALAWEPERRFATAGEMERALSLALGVESASSVPESPPRKRNFAPLVAAVAVVAVLGALAVAIVSGLVPWRTPEPATGAAGDVAVGTAESPTPGGTAGRATAGDTLADSGLIESLPERPAPLAPPAAPMRASAAPAPDTYTVQAAVIRLDKLGVRKKLDQGARLAVGDWLSLEFEASKDVYLYVINEDDQGRAYSLFPLPDLDLKNPIPGGRRHEVPGRREGKAISWEVDSVGGREHLMVLASPERLTEFETEMRRLARAQPGATALPIPDEVMVRLRGIGGVVERPDTVDAARSVDRLFEIAERLAGESEVARGAWLRRIDLENPPQ